MSYSKIQDHVFSGPHASLIIHYTDDRIMMVGDSYRENQFVITGMRLGTLDGMQHSFDRDLNHTKSVNIVTGQAGIDPNIPVKELAIETLQDVLNHDDQETKSYKKLSTPEEILVTLALRSLNKTVMMPA